MPGTDFRILKHLLFLSPLFQAAPMQEKETFFLQWKKRMMNCVIGCNWLGRWWLKTRKEGGGEMNDELFQ